MLLCECIYMYREVGTANVFILWTRYVYEFVIQFYTLRLDQIYSTSKAQI